jgi:hypothetical protein
LIFGERRLPALPACSSRQLAANISSTGYYKEKEVFTARIDGQAARLARLARLAACAPQASAKTHRGATVHGSVTTTLDHFAFAGVIARKIKLPNQSGFATPSR